MKYIQHNAGNIASFPSANDIRRAKMQNSVYEISLPVMVLSFFRDPNWTEKRPPILLVTDFSVNNNLHFPNGAQKYFTFNNSKKRLELNKVFAISVPLPHFNSISSKLHKAIGPNEYDFTRFDLCLIESEKLIVKVTIRLKEFAGNIESWLDKDTLTEYDDVLSSNEDRESVRLIRKRFNEEPDDVYDGDDYEGQSSDSSSRYVSPRESPQKEVVFTKPQRSIPISEQPQNKRAKPNNNTKTSYSQLPDTLDEFSQDFLQAKAEPFEDPDTQCELEPVDTTPNPAQIKTSPSRVISHSHAPKIEADVPIDELSCIIKDFSPSSFIVKPFGRTLKIAPFKIFAQNGEDYKIFELEFITESEICNFLGLQEIEEALEMLPFIENQSSLVKENGRQSRVSYIKIQKKVQQFTANVERCYWTCLTPLREL